MLFYLHRGPYSFSLFSFLHLKTIIFDRGFSKQKSLYWDQWTENLKAHLSFGRGEQN